MHFSQLQVLYNILDWPTKPHSKLIVIGTVFPISAFETMTYTNYSGDDKNKNSI